MGVRPVPSVAIVFVLTGLVSATWAASIPETQQRLQLSPGGLGLAVLAIEGGALLGLPVGGMLVARYGARTGLLLGFVLYPTLLLPAALAPSLVTLAAVLVVWAAANSVVDVSMNAAGVELEARSGRPLLSRLHAGQSAGLLAGGLVATGAAAGHLPLAVHFGAVAFVATFAGLGVGSRVRPDAPRQRVGLLALPCRGLALLGVLAFCAFLVEGTASTWAAVDLRSEQHADASLAAAGYTSLVAAIAFVRLLGDLARGRHGRARVVRTGGLAAAAGIVVVVLAPDVGVALAGWTLVGAGVALLAPTVLSAAPHVRTASAGGPAIAAVTTVGYLGSFTGPPIVGALAGAGSLHTALVPLVVASLAVAALSSRVLP